MQGSAALLTEPNLDYVQRRLGEFDRDDHFSMAESAVGLVFRQWPTNTDDTQVLVKASVLNQLYHTNIYDVQTVAKHIVGLGIDEPLHRGDTSLIHGIAAVQLKGKEHLLLSFATKYCSWHEPERYEIFDSYVEHILSRYQSQFTFASFREHDLHDYPRFLEIIDRFREHFGLTSIGRKQLDKFLWNVGKTDLQPPTAG